MPIEGPRAVQPNAHPKHKTGERRQAARVRYSAYRGTNMEHLNANIKTAKHLHRRIAKDNQLVGPSLAADGDRVTASSAPSDVRTLEKEFR